MGTERAGVPRAKVHTTLHLPLPSGREKKATQ